MSSQLEKHVFHFSRGGYVFTSVSWFVCQQGHTKNTSQISMKLGWRMGPGSEKSSFNLA